MKDFLQNPAGGGTCSASISSILMPVSRIWTRETLMAQNTKPTNTKLAENSNILYCFKMQIYFEGCNARIGKLGLAIVLSHTLKQILCGNAV